MKKTKITKNTRDTITASCHYPIILVNNPITTFPPDHSPNIKSVEKAINLTNSTNDNNNVDDSSNMDLCFEEKSRFSA